MYNLRSVFDRFHATIVDDATPVFGEPLKQGCEMVLSHCLSHHPSMQNGLSSVMASVGHGLICFPEETSWHGRYIAGWSDNTPLWRAARVSKVLCMLPLYVCICVWAFLLPFVILLKNLVSHPQAAVMTVFFCIRHGKVRNEVFSSGQKQQTCCVYHLLINLVLL